MTEGSGRPAEAEALLAQGKAELAAKNFEAAAATLTRALEVRPGDVDILFERGLALLKKGDYAGGERDYAAILERAPENRNARFNRAYCLRLAQKWADSEAEYGRYLERKPDDEDGYLHRGIVRIAQNKEAAAQADLDVANRIRPGHAETLFQRGRALLGQGKWQDAILDFDASLKASAETTNAYYQRAWCRGKLGDHAGAVEDYDRYLALYPDHVDARLYRGNRRFDLCDLRGTLADYEKVLQLDPSYEKDLRTWIDLARKIEKLERDGPNDQFVAACLERGVAKRDAGENATAILWFERALEVDPNAADALHGRAMAYLNLGKHAEALLDCSRAIEIKPDRNLYWHERGRAKRMAKDYKAAILDFNRALELDPSYVYSYGGRGFAYLQMEDFVAAEKDYRRFTELDPNCVGDVWYNLGWSLRKQGRHAEAIGPLTKAVEKNPADPDSWCQRGYARKETGDKDGARADLRKAIELKPALKEEVEAYIAAMDAAPAAPAKKAPDVAAAPPPVPGRRSPLKGLLLYYLLPCGVLGGLGMSGIPVLGDLPARAMDMPLKASWIVSHWTDAAAFPPESNLCMEPFCMRTDTSKKYVGGRRGYTSQVHYYYCPEHEPHFFSTGARFDGFLYFCYWGLVLLLSLLWVPLLLFPLYVAASPLLLIGMAAKKLTHRVFLPLSKAGVNEIEDRISGLFLMTGLALLLAGWIAYAWW